MADEAKGAAAAVPAIVPTPATGPAKSAVELASDAARAKIAAGQSPTDGLPDPNNVEDGRGRPVKLPPRSPTDTGKFSKGGKKEVGEGIPDPRNRSLEGDEPDDEEEDAPDDGNDDESDDTDADDAEDGDADDEAADDDLDEDDEGADDEDRGEGEEDEDSLIVTLPGRREGQELTLEVDNPETAQALRQLKNGYMAGNAIRAATSDIETKYSQLEQVRDDYEADPAQFMLTHLDDRPDVRAHVAMALLTDPKVWEMVNERVLNLADPDKAEGERQTVKIERYEMRDSLKQAAQERREVRTNLQAIQSTVAQLTPTDMEDADQAAFYRDAMLGLKAYAEDHDLLTIPVADVPVLLARVMKAHGINPVEAAARIGKGGTSVRPMKPGKQAPEPREKPRRSGKDFVRGREKRRAAARVAPAGAGAPTTASALTPPKRPDGTPMSVAETTAWHREQLKKGRRLLTPGQRTG